MKKVLLFATLGTIAFMTLAFQSQPTEWEVNTDDATIAWELPYEPSPEGGSIAGLKAEVKFDPDDLANSRIVASVESNTITSDSKLKTKHLKEKKGYLEAKDYPEITFESQQFTVTGPTFEAKGIVNFKGVDFEVTVPFEFNQKKKKGEFTGSFEMNTKDMGIVKDFKSLKEGTVQNNLRITFTLPVAS